MLDWTEAEVTDPATDFGLHYATFGEDSLDVLLKQYQIAGGKVWPKMKEHVIELWAAFQVTAAMFALRTGQEADLAQAKTMLGK